MGKGRNCDSCRFCCYSFGVADIPDEIKGLKFKSALNHCPFECSMGCSIHEEKKYPQSCKDFICPYLEGEDIYRPNIFQPLLEKLNGNIGNYIPNISPKIPIKEAENLITKSRSIPASIIIGKEWIKVVMPLDKEVDKSWLITQKRMKQWKKLYQNYGVKFNSPIKKDVKMI